VHCLLFRPSCVCSRFSRLLICRCYSVSLTYGLTMIPLFFFRHLRAGSVLIVFLLRGPLNLVAISAKDTLPVLRRQLQLLYNIVISATTQGKPLPPAH
jgi:hypothetical protein